MEKSRLHIFPAMDNGLVAVMPIGGLDELECNVTETELKSVEHIHSASRRAERLAWRALLRELEPAAQVEYLPSGKPEIKNSKYQHLSVSHCRDFVAVALSSKPCGIDIERCDRNFGRVKSRYMSDEEVMLSAHNDWSAVVWCAKEALYKMAGREGVDFKRDIIIRSAQMQDASWKLSAELFGAESVTLGGSRIDDNHILVYTI